MLKPTDRSIEGIDILREIHYSLGVLLQTYDREPALVEECDRYKKLHSDLVDMAIKTSDGMAGGIIKLMLSREAV